MTEKRKSTLAEIYRQDAAYHERVATAADRDGDKWHATFERGKAADARQKAREIEAREDAL